MPRKTYDEVKAGIFVIGCLIVAMIVMIWLGGAGLFSSRQEVVFYMPADEGSTGVDVGSFVTVNDANVGKVTSVVHDWASGRTLYFADLEPDAKLRSDAKLEVSSGLVGASDVVITFIGSDDSPRANKENPALLDVGGIAGAIKDFKIVAEQIKKEMDREASEALLAKIHIITDNLVNTSQSVMNIGQNVEVETDVALENSLITKFHASADDINEMTADTKPKLKQTMSSVVEVTDKVRAYTNNELAAIFVNIRSASTEIYKVAQDFAVVSQEAKGIMLVNRERIDETIDNISIVSANLKAASKDIRRNPWRLLYQPDEKELQSQNIYDAARAFSNGAEQLDQAILKLGGLAQLFPEGIPATDKQLIKIRQQLIDSFSRFNEAEQSLWQELKK